MMAFQQHQGFTRTFQENKLTLGLLMPLESYTGSFPTMDLVEQITLAKKVEEFGFASLFVRDSPIYDPNFGDVGFLYDPLMFLTYVAAQTEKIALGTASVVTTLRNPLHLAKSVATLDRLSNERFLFGAATGDRPIEFPAFKVDPEDKGMLFKEAITVMREVWQTTSPKIQMTNVQLTEGDIVPKPKLANVPILGTGYSGQTLDWLAQHTDGWLFYPQAVNEQRALIQQWREAAGMFKPFSQPVAIDLSENPREAPKPIQGGFRTGHKFLLDYLYAYQDAGVNHAIFGLKSGKRPAEEVIQELGEFILPEFPSHTK